MAGQTLNDRLTAARHTLAGQGLARIVCKATTEEVIGPKKKHLDYLLHCTNEPNVSIPQLANLLIERTQNASWVVVFKALVTVHHLMCYGNERFTQYLASSNCTFQLSNFLDKQGYDMSTFIRRYAKYLNEKAMSYRAVAFDFCKAKRGKEDGTLRTMPTDKLLKALPVLQTQLDALLEFDCTSNDLTNGVINSCFMLLFRDLIRLFACYNDGIINLLEKFFDMNKKNCREALDIYKKFLIRMDRVAELLKVAENVGIDKGDIPDLTKAPSSLLDALEQHLAALEGKKGPQPTTNARNSNLKHAVNALLSTSHSFGSAASNGPATTDFPSGTSKAQEVIRKAVEEEAAAMDQMRFEHDSPLSWDQPPWDLWEQRLKDKTSDDSPPQPSSKTNPFLSSPAAPDQGSSQGIIDLFSSSPPTSTAGIGGGGSQGASDLLCLAGNPFADSLFGSSAGGANVIPQTSQPSTATPFSAAPPPQPSQIPFVSFNATPNGVAPGVTSAPLSTAPPPSSGFGTEVNFAAAFGSDATGTSGFDNFGDILQPQAVGTTSALASTSAVPPLVKAPLIAPTSALDGSSASNAKGSLIKGDLDSSLASLCQNLDINGPNQSLKKGAGHQWGSPKMSGKTGGSGWAPPAATPPNIAAWGMPTPPAAAPAGAPFPPAAAPQWGGPSMAGRPMMPAAGGPPIMPQPFAAPAMAGMRPHMGIGPQPPMAPPPGGIFPGNPPQPPPTSSSAVNDPFGAL